MAQVDNGDSSGYPFNPPFNNNIVPQGPEIEDPDNLQSAESKRQTALGNQSLTGDSQASQAPEKMHPLPVTVEDCEDELKDLSSESIPRIPATTSSSVTPTNVTNGDNTRKIGVPVSAAFHSDSRTTQEDILHSKAPTLPTQHLELHQPRPNAMHYLQSSPSNVSPEAMHRVFQDRNNFHGESQQSPSSHSHGSSIGSSYRTGVFSDRPAPDAWSYESCSPDRRPMQTPSTVKLEGFGQPGYPQPHALYQSFRSPVMPQQQNDHATLSRNNMQMQYPDAGHNPPFTELEHVSISGYQLLAEKLAGGISGPPVKPIYRRFEALNHRLLLHMQDELAELEEQLQGLDSADTQARWHPHGLIPDCRRHWLPNSDDLAMRKMDILGQIGFKLDRYSTWSLRPVVPLKANLCAEQIMASFKETQDFARPSMAEVQEYKSYLAFGQHIAEKETKFLDCVDDLVSLAIDYEENPNATLTEDILTPIPRPVDEAGFPPPIPVSELDRVKSFRRHPDRDGSRVLSSLSQLALGLFMALLVPVLTFIVIPDFIGRMTVVGLVVFGVAIAGFKSGLFKLLSHRFGILDWLLWFGLYGGVMAVVAGSFRS